MVLKYKRPPIQAPMSIECRQIYSVDKPLACAIANKHYSANTGNFFHEATLIFSTRSSQSPFWSNFMLLPWDRKVYIKHEALAKRGLALGWRSRWTRRVQNILFFCQWIRLSCWTHNLGGLLQTIGRTEEISNHTFRNEMENTRTRLLGKDKTLQQANVKCSP